MAGGTSDTGARRFSRIPPESTGDRMLMVHTAEIEYSGKQALDTSRGSVYEWTIGNMYNIGGAFGMVHVHSVYEKDADSGIIAVHYNKTATFENTSPAVGALISFSGDQKATVVAAYDVMIPGTNVVGYDNPDFGLDVDITGSANVRFAEGLPQLDAWGKLRTSGATQIGSYVFSQEGGFKNNFSTTNLSGGYSTYDDNRKSARTGVDGTGGADQFSAATSITYHNYIPGSSHLYMGTARLNDPTAANVSRSWGLFDQNNGFMFRVESGGTLNAVIRSSTTGSTLETLIPQSSWNGDKLDGSGDSQETLDLTKNNIWWMDILWHGAGRVRFGTYYNGQRIVCHSYYHGNLFDTAMSQTASLPVCTTTIATGAGPTSNVFVEQWSASVWTEVDIDLTEKGSPATYATSHFTITADGTDPWQYLFSLSPRIFSGTDINHGLFQPTSISAFAYDTAATNGVPAIIDLKAEANAQHSGHSFTSVSGTLVEVSTAGTSFMSGKTTLNEMFMGRYHADLTDTYNNFQYGALNNLSDDGGTVSNSIQSLTSASPAVLTIGSSERLLVRETTSQGTPAFSKNISGYNGRYQLTGITGMTEANDSFVYVKPISSSSVELYTDEALSVPFDSSGFTTHDTNTGTITGFGGSRVIWSFFAKTKTAVHSVGPVKLMVTINWKEIDQ